MFLKRRLVRYERLNLGQRLADRVPVRDRQLDAARCEDFRLVAIAWELQGDWTRKETSQGLSITSAIRFGHSFEPSRMPKRHTRRRSAR